MEKLGFNYNDGGRAKYFSAERVGDCVCRAIAIGNDMDYKESHPGIPELLNADAVTTIGLLDS